MKRRILNLNEIIRDLKSGLGDIPVMERHGLSPSELLEIHKKIRAAKNAKPKPKRSRTPAPRSAAKGRERRSLRRHYLALDVTIVDANNPSAFGRIVDINKKGLQVEGLKSRTGEVRTLMVLDSATFRLDKALVFDAECRWINKPAPNAYPLAGFKIVKVVAGNIGVVDKISESIGF
ncbi:hypothetical protein ACFL2Q_17225 [Thermodesulfobacteriota bacterium]